MPILKRSKTLSAIRVFQREFTPAENCEYVTCIQCLHYDAQEPASDRAMACGHKAASHADYPHSEWLPILYLLLDVADVL